MREVTEQDIKSLKDTLQNIITTVLDHAQEHCCTIEDLENFDYRVQDDDLLVILRALQVETVKIVKIDECPLDYYAFFEVFN